jgi:small redox-active disulfide protein 2
MLNVKILGPGCYNCERLQQVTVEALETLGAEATIQKVTDYGEFARYGLLYTPGLVVNEKLVSAGRVPPVADVVTLLTTAMVEAEGAA